MTDAASVVVSVTVSAVTLVFAAVETNTAKAVRNKSQLNRSGARRINQSAVLKYSTACTSYPLLMNEVYESAQYATG